jgi:hypothetical protein
MVRQHTTKRCGAKLRVETLEPRMMLDGNVTAAVHGGELVICGDSAGNQVTVTEVRTLGVLGYSISGQSGTRINGRRSDFIQARDVTGGVNIDLSNGSDCLVIAKSGLIGLTFAGDLDIDVGYGKVDRVVLKDVTVKGNLHVDASRTNQAIVALTCASVGGDACITTGDGADSVCVDNSCIGHNLKVCTDDGKDTAAIKRTKVACETSVAMGCGDDCLTMKCNSFKKACVSGNSGKNQLAEAKNSGSLEVHDFTRV